MKKKRAYRALIGTTLMVLGLSLVGAVAQPFSSLVFAEESSDAASDSSSEADEHSSTLVVTPMWQAIVLTPGENWSGSIRVRNPATAKQNLKYSVSVGSYSEVPNDESDVTAGTTTDIETVTGYNQMMDWITISNPSGEIAPNDSEDVEFTINVPSDAPGGGQYASIIVRNDTEQQQNEGNVMIQSTSQAASVIYAEVAGESRKEVKILENNIPGFLLNGALEASSVVENTGNVHAPVTYSLTATPLGSNEDVCSDDDEETERIAMPGVKLYHVEKCELAPVGIYKVKQTVKVFGEVSDVEQMLFVCPIWLIVVIAIVVIAIIALIVRLITRRK